MLSLKTCLMNIIKNIKTLNTWKSETVDYIVEKGTIGTNDAYTYVKYNSGLCLCWGGGITLSALLGIVTGQTMNQKC